MTDTFFITGDPEADALLGRDPLALLLGMLLDQQVPMESAFAGPHKLQQRLGGLDAGAIASMDPADLVAAFKQRPAVHRFPGSMAARAQQLCQVLSTTTAAGPTPCGRGGERSGAGRRLEALPGFGTEKARIFAAVLGKRLAVRPPGWEEAAAPFSDEQRRSVADAVDPATLVEVAAWKRAKKAAGKAKTD
jgi:uncharacterized HhH-GPD family protein